MNEFVWRRLLEFGLAPVLLAQALYVRRTVERLPEPDGPRTGVQGQGPQLRLLIVGDSAAAGVGVDRQDDALSGQLIRRLAPSYQVQWHVHARTGETTASTLTRLRELEPQAADYAVISLGVNDATGGVSPRRWRLQLDALQAELRERHGVQHAWYAALPPVHAFPALPQPMRSLLGGRARALDQVLAHWCADQADRSRLSLDLSIDPGHMARDGFHPGASVYRSWGERAANLIRAHHSAAQG